MSNPLRLARPTFLKDKQDIKAMDNYIKNKCQGGTGFTLFDSVGKDNKNRFNDLYKPVIDQDRIFEMHQVEKRFKMNFEQKKKGYYSDRYLISMSELLAKKSKNYIKKKRKLIDQSQPLYSDEFNKKFKARINTISINHKRRNINLYITSSNFDTISKTINVKMPLLTSRSQKDTIMNDNLEIKDPIDNSEKGINKELQKIEKCLKKSYKFYSDKKKKNKMNFLLNIYNDPKVNYEKCNNPSQREYFNAHRRKSQI